MFVCLFLITSACHGYHFRIIFMSIFLPYVIFPHGYHFRIIFMSIFFPYVTYNVTLLILLNLKDRHS